MNKYRSHNCRELKITDIHKEVTLSGWVFRVREHANLIFVDLKDHYGIVQLVFKDQDLITKIKNINFETVITVKGVVVARTLDSVNKNISTGEIEINVTSILVQSEAINLPFSINTENKIPEQTRLKYRFLDLRRDSIQKKIIFRSKVISYIRKIMEEKNFTEIQTPILTASSPEGAKDFLVPSSTYPGKFYALPQAPQQFKQLLMLSRIDKYFQIAPCFRDEASRADRSPGEFYQLDIELSFVEQEDIFRITEEILIPIFSKFSNKKIHSIPFKRISYDEAIKKYATDKPDLRNPIKLSNVEDIFIESKFELFVENIKKGFEVIAIPAPNALDKKSKKFFQEMELFAKSLGEKGLGNIQFHNQNNTKGPIAKFLSPIQINELKKRCNASDSDTIFFICNEPSKIRTSASKIRDKIGYELNLVNDEEFVFCWVTDFYLYEFNEDTKKIEFSHNPFSLPQKNIDELDKYKPQSKDLLEIKSFQYDLVCNGVELSSGAIRNHKIDLFYKVFELIGHGNQYVDKSFPAMTNALKYGAPPHGGIAPGIERIIMLLTNTQSLREIVAFPMNQQAQDLLMQAPADISDTKFKELKLKKDIKS